MSIVLVFNHKDAEPWAAILRKKLPGVTVEIYPKVTQPELITFALCWKADFDIITQFPNVKVLQSVGASVDHILNTQTITAHTQVARINDFNLKNDMWEFVLAGILAEIKNFNFYNKAQTTQKWAPKEYKSIEESVITILGLGQIGIHVAQKLANFGFIVNGWSNSPKLIDRVHCGNNEDDLNDFLAKTDFLINILPFTAATENILNAKLFNQIKKGTYLINVGRGEHLNEDDFLDALNNGALVGALLDVFKTEPLPKNHSFWQNPAIKITPHIASLTNVNTASEVIVANYKAHIANTDLLYTVSTQKGY